MAITFFKNASSFITESVKPRNGSWTRMLSVID